jgi:hypothetical protein
MALHHTKLLALLALLGPVASSEIPSHGRMLSDPGPAQCYTCFSEDSSGAWGWYMGPFDGSLTDVTYEYPMYRSNTNGCDRMDYDPDTLTGTMTLTVTDTNNDMNLQFNVVVETISPFQFSQSQVYISVTEPGPAKPPPGLLSSQCFAPGYGISEPTCSGATLTSQTHVITDDTANPGSPITTGQHFYIWIHAVEIFLNPSETVYARSNNGQECVPNHEVCFHGATLVTLEDKSRKAMTELQLGDVIQTSDSKGNLGFAPVTSLPHEAGNSEIATFLKLSTESGKSVHMTPGHLLPNCVGKTVSASELVIGDCLFVVDGDITIKETLVEISSATLFGVNTAVTDAQFIVADGIVASSFALDNDPGRKKIGTVLDYLNSLVQKTGKKLRGAKKVSML